MHTLTRGTTGTNSSIRIIAIGSEGIYDSDSGEVVDRSRLSDVISKGAGGIFTGCNLYEHVASLNQEFGDDEAWRMRIRSQQVRNPLKNTRIGFFQPMMFGFVWRNKYEPRCHPAKRVKRKSRTFQCLDLKDFLKVNSCTIAEAIDFTESIIGLCELRGVKFTTGRGALAGRLLKASPHWSPTRQAAPRFINRFVRTKLPGNFYALGTKPNVNHKSAIYVDQVSAHHNVAATTPLPDPMRVRAIGCYNSAARGIANEWQKDTPKGIGLLACMVNVKNIPNARKHLYPPMMHTPGRRLEYVYTNELAYFDGTDGVIEYICAGWISDRADTAIPEYARWAMDNRNGGPGRKSLLLAAYGYLALNIDGDPIQSYRQRSAKGTQVEIPGAGTVSETVRIRDPNSPQPTIVNVLARGMIEAETRRRSIEYARELDSSGLRILSVYVDGLIVETDAMPFPRNGWTIESSLSNLVFQHPTSFIADEMRKQPGVPRLGVYSSDQHRAHIREQRQDAFRR